MPADLPHSRMPRALHALLGRRTGARTPPFELSGRRIYIRPTRNGLYFALLVALMLLGALNYANSLAFVLAFMLAALGLVCMHHTQRNLLRLRVQALSAAPVHAGDDVCFTLMLANDTRLPRQAVAVKQLQPGATTTRPHTRIGIDVHTQCRFDLIQPALRRGRMSCPPLHVYSDYPLGLFKAWSRLDITTRTIIYPAPGGDLPLPKHPAGGGDTSAPVHGDAEFRGHRNYVAGDSPRHIDWKASARSDTLLVTRHDATQDDILWLDMAALASWPLEARLSQLTRWVLEADTAGLRYGLRLGTRADDVLGPDTGATHKHACLAALALFA